MASAIMNQLKNPWIMAAAMAGLSYVAINKMKPAMIYNADNTLKNPMITPITAAAAVAVAIIAFNKFSGKSLALPGSKSPLQQALDRRGAGELLGPESFRV